MTQMLFLLGCVHIVDIAVVGAEISPAMANGAAWDGPDNVPTEAMGLLGSALSHLDPSGQLGGVVSGAVDTMVKPDPAGTVMLYPGPEQDPFTVLLPVLQDTLFPTWGDTPSNRLGGVTVRAETVIRVTLVDKDVQTDDPIGTVELTAADVGKAQRAGKVLVIDVSGQASGQLKSVSVVVRKVD